MAFFKRFYKGKRAGNSEDVSKAPASRAEGGSVFGRLAAWWKRRSLLVRIALIAGASVLVLASGAYAAVRLWVRAPAEPGIIINYPTPSAAVHPSGAPPAPAPSGGEDPEPSPAPPEYVKREGVYTFLLAGVNEGLADTLMIATLDTAQGTCYVLSIPRDTVIGSAPRSVQKINGAYIQRKDVDEPGIPELKKEIATLIGYQPQYAAVIDYNAFKALVRAVGGVEFYVPMDMYVIGEDIDLKKGQQLLNADQALQLVRFRVNHYPDPEDPRNGRGYDDYGRIRMQQQFLSAVAKKALSNWTKFNDYIDIAKKNVKSDDMDWGNMLWLAEQVNKIGMDDVVFVTLPTVTVRRPAEIAGEYYEAVVVEEALELINDTINPFSIPIGEELVEYTVLTER